MTQDARRRKTDARSFAEGLSREERADLDQRRLATVVSAACDAWLAARGIKPRLFNCDPSGGILGPVEGHTPRDGFQSDSPSPARPIPVPFSYVPDFRKKRGNRFYNHQTP